MTPPKSNMEDRTTEPHKPDPTGLAVARVAQDAAAPDTVILFGSRARGDHRKNSDLDLLVVCRQGTTGPGSRMRRAISKHFDNIPPRLNVDIITMERQKFNYCRRAKNHLAGQAMRDGIVMSGKRLDYTYNYDDEYPKSWPDVKERLIAAHRNMRAFGGEINHPDGEQEIYGFQAQQSVENSIKAWMSAANLEYRRAHDLEEVSDIIFGDHREAKTLAAQRLQTLIEYTSCETPDRPGEYENWLTRYAVDHRYSGTGFRMDNLDKAKFHREINLAVHTFIDRAHELTGTNASDLQ